MRPSGCATGSPSSTPAASSPPAARRPCWPVSVAARRPATGSTFAAFTALARRRVSLSAHTPREVLVPLLTPILFADVIAPALAKAIPATRGIDYLSFVAVGTIGLLVPLSCILGGIGMIVDRESGAQRDLLAEILAARTAKQEEYVGVAPPVALLAWFFAGSFFPI